MRSSSISLFAVTTLFVIIAGLTGCTENSVETRLKEMTGRDYLALDEKKRTEFLQNALDFFRAEHRKRSDFMCQSLLSSEPLSELFTESAITAQDNLLVHVLSVRSAEWCIEKGEFFK